jgi:hypothetical protein
MNYAKRERLSSTGPLLADLTKFRIGSGKSHRMIAAIKSASPVAALQSSGLVVIPAPIRVTREPIKQRKFDRFVLQSKKRTAPPPVSANYVHPVVDKGFKFEAPIKREHRVTSASCPIRVIRKVLHIGRPEYLGAGVWA